MEKISTQEIKAEVDIWKDEDGNYSVDHILFTIDLELLSLEQKEIIKNPMKTSIIVCPDYSDKLKQFLVIGFKK